MYNFISVPVLILHFLLLINNFYDVSAGLRVLNGTAAKNGMFPYVVYIAFKDAACTGSIITATNVLTAAHCYLKFPEGTTSNDEFIGACIAGEVYIRKPKPDTIKGLQSRHVAKFVMHPKFKVEGQYDPRFDFAVLTVLNPFTFTKYVKAIRLATQDLTEGQSCITVGFGRQAYNNTEEVEADLAWFQTTATEINCAGPGTTCTATPAKAAYYGDSGGPLILALRKPKLYGVLSSMRVLIHLPSAGTIYASVPANIDWIIENSDLPKKITEQRSGENRIRENPLVFLSAMQLVSSMY